MLTAILIPTASFAHTRILPTGTLLPRNTIANKVGPCGVPRGTTVTYLIAGQPLTVQFEEYIEHTGHYRIAFSPAADADFDTNVLVDNIPDKPGATATNPNEYSQNITVPNTPCTNCTIQVIQVMLDNPAMPTDYFSCADIVILPAGSTLPAQNPGPYPPGSSGGAGGAGGCK
jgi:hypothetical protein